MSATAETRSGKARGLLVAGVVSLALAALFVVWRGRRDGAHESGAATTDESRAPSQSASTPSASTTPHERTFRGRFVFVDGEPAASVGFRVESRPADDAPYEVVARGLSRSDGSFSLQLYENWQVGRAVRIALSEVEQLEVDSREFDLSSGAPLEVELKGARVVLEDFNARGVPRRGRHIDYEHADPSGAMAAESLRFGVTDQFGRVHKDFRTPTTIVVWATNGSGTRCSDRAVIAMQPGVRANRDTLTCSLPPGGLYVTVVDELDRPIERAGLLVSRSGQLLEPSWGSSSVHEYELLHPGEYVLDAIPPWREDEHDDLAAQQRAFVSRWVTASTTCACRWLDLQSSCWTSFARASGRMQAST